MLCYAVLPRAYRSCAIWCEVSRPHLAVGAVSWFPPHTGRRYGGKAGKFPLQRLRVARWLKVWRSQQGPSSLVASERLSFSSQAPKYQQNVSNNLYIYFITGWMWLLPQRTRCFYHLVISAAPQRTCRSGVKLQCDRFSACATSLWRKPSSDLWKRGDRAFPLTNAERGTPNQIAGAYYYCLTANWRWYMVCNAGIWYYVFFFAIVALK